MTQHETHTPTPISGVDGGDTDTTFNLCKQMSVTCIETERVGTLGLSGANGGGGHSVYSAYLTPSGVHLVNGSPQYRGRGLDQLHLSAYVALHVGAHQEIVLAPFLGC